ncbi:MAG: hypothetical protein HC857_01675 [Synechococcales cyanobacterium RU_4_20]|nr:hypothetical protein [Synechococcales cyanobacterium RU_4_20]
MNPNGILFGPNAQLDISGSFVGTTAERVEFGEGLSFSAVNPQAAPLLQINLTPGLQYGAVSLGQIQTQGSLQVGGDLSLAAQSGVRVQDSAQQAVRLDAGKDLVIEGGEVAIDTLSHPKSLLSAGGDVVLRSPNPIQADAHVRSGGSFRIEQLDGSLNSFWSPEDPIIQAAGDIQFNSYTGASLHLFAGGSVTSTGKITITGPDVSGNALQETVVLSDGTAVSVDGVNRPVLDIRAGTTARPLSQGGGAGFNNAPTVSGATGSNIQLGRVEVKAPNGLVLLTNQYQPNLTLAAGDIRAQGIFTDQRTGNVRQTTANFVGNGGDVAIDARGSIAIAPRSQINTSALPAAGNGGNITLLAGQAINLSSPPPAGASNPGGSEYFLRVDSTAKFGRAGDITMKAPSVLLDNVELISELDTRGNGRSGNMLIVADQLKADNFTDFYADSKGKGDAGFITLRARDIQLLGGTRLRSRLRNDGNNRGEGRSGDILIVADTLKADKSPLNDFTARIDTVSDGKGDSGNILITANSLEMNSSQFNASTGGPGNAGNVTVQLAGDMVMRDASRIDSNGSSQKGVAGTISINANSLSMINSTMTSRVNTKGGDNGILLNLKGDLLIDARVDARGNKTAGLFTDARQNAVTDAGEREGNITVNAENITLIGSEARIQGGSIGLTGGGKITLNVRDTLRANEGWVVNGAGASSTGPAQNLTIKAGHLELVNGGRIESSTQSTGSGGVVSIEADTVLLTGEGKILTYTSESGDASDINIKANQSVYIVQDGLILSGVINGGTGDGGDITIDTPLLVLESGGRIEATTEGVNVDLAAARLKGKPYGDVILDDKPVAYWSLDETTGTLAPNRVGNGFDGTYRGNVDQSVPGITGITGTAARFDGRNGEIRINDDLDLDGKRSFVIEAWIKPDPNNPPSEQVIFGSHTADKDNQSLHLRLHKDGRIELGLWGGSDLETPVGQLPFDNEWHHVVARVIRDPGIPIRTTRIDIDGREAAVGTKGPFEGDGATTRIGSWGREVSPQFFKGSIDEVAVYQLDIRPGNADFGPNIGLLDRHYFAGLLSQGVSVEAIAARFPGEAKAGNITVNADEVRISGVAANPDNRFNQGSGTRGISSGLFSGSEQQFAGAGGEIDVNTRLLNISDAGVISSTTISQFKAGTIDVKAEQVNLTGGGQLVTTSRSAGAAGSINVEAQQINLSGVDPLHQQRVTDAGEKSGTRIDVDGSSSGFFSRSTGSGVAGNITVSGTEQLELDDVTIQDGAKIAVDSQGSGIGGNIILNSRSLALDNGQIIAESANSDGGNIFIGAKPTDSQFANITARAPDTILLRHNSLISATAGNSQNPGNGGNITINSPFVIGLPNENSDIIANAFSGTGGNITINAAAILNFQLNNEANVDRLRSNTTNDISASSQFGNSGTLNLTGLGVDPTQGTTQLPTDPSSPQPSQGCQTTNTTGQTSQGEFLPPDAAASRQIRAIR